MPYDDSDNDDALATAHVAWNARWTDPDQRRRWENPEPLVQALVPIARARGFRRAVDIGCGIGRHAQFLASQGFSCVGIDASENALALARANAAEAGLAIDYRRGTFYELPLDDASVDVVVAWNVIYHGDGEIVRRALAEFERVLVPGGLYVGSMLSTRNVDCGRGREVRPNTFVVDDGPDDKAHPHFYVGTHTLFDLHKDFDIFELRDCQQRPGAYHWEFLLELVKRATRVE